MTEFKQKVLKVLEKLQYLCDVAEAYGINTKKGIVYCFDEMFPPIGNPEELEYVVQYLNKSGLEISITFDIRNESPDDDVYVKKYAGEIGRVPLGLIKGKNRPLSKVSPS